MSVLLYMVRKHDGLVWTLPYLRDEPHPMPAMGISSAPSARSYREPIP